MGLHLRQPTASDLRRRAERQANEQLTYEPVGVTELDEAVDGYRTDRWQRSIGHGGAVFAAAATALRTWAVHRGARLIVEGDDVAVDGIVAMAAPLPIGYVDVVCRIVDVVDEPREWSFTYGTLPDHPEQGEERFRVTWDADTDEVVFDIVAVSTSRHPLARLAPPIALKLQTAATTRYLDAMEAAIADQLA